MLRPALAGVSLALLAATPLTAAGYTVAPGPLERSACEESTKQPSSTTQKPLEVDTTPSAPSAGRIIIRVPSSSEGNGDSVSVCHKETKGGKDQPTTTTSTEVRRQ